MASTFKKIQWLESDLQFEEEGSKYFTAVDKRNKTKVMVKLFDEDENIPKKVLRALKESSNQCLLRIIDYGLVEKGIFVDQMVIVMEVYDVCHSLDNLIKTQGALETDDFVSLVQCLSGGFEHLWNENISLLNFNLQSIVYIYNPTTNTKVFKIKNFDKAKIFQNSKANDSEERSKEFLRIGDVLMKSALGLGLLREDNVESSSSKMTVKNDIFLKRILSSECKLSTEIKQLLIPFLQKIFNDKTSNNTKENYFKFCENCIACIKTDKTKEPRPKEQEKNIKTSLIKSALNCLQIENWNPRHFNLQNTLQVHSRDVVSESPTCIHMVGQLLHSNYSDAFQLAKQKKIK